MRIFRDVEGLQKAVGERLGESDWLAIDQDRVDGFADATGDHQWIHVDPERAKGGPFGTTIAHGYLTLALVPALTRQIFTVDGASMAINYGIDRVRFVAPVPVGSRVRAVTELVAAEPVGAGVQTTFRTTVELEGSPKPACVAEHISRYSF